MNQNASTRFDAVSRKAISKVTRPHRYAVISIRDPFLKPAYLRDDPNRIGTMKISFDDIPYVDTALGLTCFTPRNADDILDFAGYYVPRACEIIINCEAGISRSRGVALALARIYGDPTPHETLGMPNSLIVRTIIDRHNSRTGQNVPMPVVPFDLQRCPRHPAGTTSGPIDGPRTCDVCGGPTNTVRIDLITYFRDKDAR
jgi:predicted protein tyrosine phosphatase